MPDVFGTLPEGAESSLNIMDVLAAVAKTLAVAARFGK